MNTIERFAVWVESERSESIVALMLEGAKDYYSGCRHVQQDYITKKYINESMDEAFDQFYEQSSVMNVIEEYCDETGENCEELIQAIEGAKGDIITQLREYVVGIASTANEGAED